MKSKLNNYEINILLGLVYEGIKQYTELGCTTEGLWTIEAKLTRQFYENNRRRKNK